jgi:hypothetical protein
MKFSMMSLCRFTMPKQIGRADRQHRLRRDHRVVD